MTYEFYAQGSASAAPCGDGLGAEAKEAADHLRGYLFAAHRRSILLLGV